jgi:hypothetical protein
MFTSVLAATLAATLVPQALANLYITAPVASTTCTASQPCAVSWNDDGTTPALGTIGACTVGLYIGSQQTQILLQSLGDVDVSQQATASFNPDPTVGGDSDLYFLRFTAVNYMDGAYPYEGFSAKFTLTGMTGTFNATEASLMSAPTSAIGSTVSGASVSTSSVGASTTGAQTTGAQTTSSGIVSSTTTSSKASGTSAKTSTATSSSGAASPAALASSSALAGVAAVVLSAFLAAVAF